MEALVSRLCHDLAGPASAVSNGIELLGEAGAEPGDESLAMVERSIATAINRLKVFRLAFGQAGGREAIGFEELRTLAEAFLAEGHARVRFDDAQGGAEDRPVGLFRGVLGAIFVANDAMPRGGEILVEFRDDLVRLTARPDRGALIVECFSGGRFTPTQKHPVPSAGPRAAPVNALRLLVDHAGIPFALEGDESILSISFWR